MSRPDPPALSSPANPTVRHLVRMRDNRARRRSGKLIVDGWRETLRAYRAGIELSGLYATKAELDELASANAIPSRGNEDEPSSANSQLVSHAQQIGALQLVTPAIMSKISYGQSPRGVVAEFTEPDRSLANLRLGPSPLILILDRIEKPGNVGAVFRCADAAGVDAVILSDCSCDLFNPNAIRSSLGAVFTVPAASDTTQNISQFLSRCGIRPLAARVESSHELWASDLTGPLAVILGNESNGLANRWQQVDGQEIAGVRIPMNGQVDSLNISVSAALIAFEAIRVRNA
ncbi:MAG: RNA methyltransferase [Pirellulaceae bacterium]|nr:RNA methyltransferase [Pirellulaceae bacterium]